MKFLRNEYSNDEYMTLSGAKRYLVPSEEEIEEIKGTDYESDYMEWVDDLKSAETLEELAEVLNSRTDDYGNGSEYTVRCI